VKAVRRGRAAHLGPERRRPQVLDAALAIAAARGTASVTIGSIAEQLGVTRPVVYSCFADRVDILDALIKREQESLLEGLLGALHAARGDDPEAAFITGFQGLLRFVEARPDTWRLIFSASPDPAVADMFATARHALAARAAKWIAPAMIGWWQTEDLDQKLPVLIEFFVSASEAAARTLLDPENTWTTEALADFYGRIVCGSFRVA
jgi:AcrR family transcriptional regulator